MSEVVAAVLARAMETGTILLLAALGEIYAERSGVLNLGVEGMMLLGALGAFGAAHLLGNAWAGLAIAVLIGAVVSLLHSFMSVTLRLNQVATGLSIYLLGVGLSGFLGKPLVGVTVPGLPVVAFPSVQDALSKVPVIGLVLGRLLGGLNPMVYLSIALAVIMWFILFRTRWGLNIRSVGENPSMADSLGVSVFRIRYICVMIGGSLAALSGAYLILGLLGSWTEAPAAAPVTAGRGWIAIALVILAAWSPLRAILGAYLLGGVEALQYTLQGFQLGIPSQFFTMLPYISAIVVLTSFSVETVRKRIGVPAALGVSYSREE